MHALAFALPLWAGVGLLGAAAFRSHRQAPGALQALCLFVIGVLLMLVGTSVGWLLCLRCGIPVGLAPWAGLATALAFGRSLGPLSRRLAEGGETLPPRPAILLVLGCALLANLPTLWFRTHGMQGGEPWCFLTVDQPFLFGHTQALVHYGSPVDLDFAGREVRYHFGHALVAAVVTRTLGVPAGTGFFIVTAAVVRTAMAAGLLLLLSAVLKPARAGWLALAAGAAVFFLVGKLNLLDLVSRWTWPPRIEPSFIMRHSYEGSLEIAVALVLAGTVLAVARSPWLGVCLGYLGFCKPMEGFVPFGFALAVIAAGLAWRRREFGLGVGIAVGAAVLACVHPFGFVSGRLNGISLGVNLDNLARITQDAYAAVLGLAGGGVPAAGITHPLIEVPGRVLAYLVYTPLRQSLALALVVLALCRWRRCGPSGEAMRLVLAVCGLMAVAALMLPLLVVLRASPAVEACYGVVWSRTFTGLATENLAQTVATLTFVLQSFAAVVVAWGVAQERRATVGVVAVVLAINTAGYARHCMVPPRDYAEFINTRNIRPVLRAAPGDAPILTNDLDLRAADGVRPFMNHLAPALFGQPFYASAFRYLNAYDREAIERLDAVQAFWRQPPGDATARQARAWGIRHLLVRRDGIGGAAWLDGPVGPAFREVQANGDYRLLEVVGGD